MKENTDKTPGLPPTDEFRRRAEKRLKHGPEGLGAFSQKDLKALVHELQVHQVELEMQNEQLRQAQSALEESRNRYFELYELAPVGYFTLDGNGLILEANLTGAQMLGAQRRDLKGKTFSRFVSETDKGRFFTYLNGLSEGQILQTCDLGLVAADHTHIYVRMESRPVGKGIEGGIHIRSAIMDITQQRQAQLALMESEERFRLIAETSLDVIFQIDSNGRILYCSPSSERFLGYTPAEVKGTPFEAYLAPSDVPGARQYFQRLIFGERISAFEFTALSKSGVPVIFEISVAPLMKDGKVKFIYGIARDISERKEAEEALKQSEAHLRIAVEGGNLGTWSQDLITGKTIWNQLLYDLLGRDPKRTITRETFFQYIHMDDLPRVRAHLEAAYRSEPVFIDEFRIVREDGQVRWMAAFGRIYRGPTGEPVRIAGINFDITDRKQVEESLRKAHDTLEKQVQARAKELIQANQELQREVAKRKRYADRLRSSTKKILSQSKRRRFLSKRLVEILERNRRDVAMYLHDQIGQVLATLKMDLELACNLPGETSKPLNEKLGRAAAKVADVMGQIRDISRRLRPDILDTLGLVPALRSLVDGFRSEVGLRIHFHCTEPFPRVDPDKSLALYRILQEALNNVRKHSRAAEVFVNLIVKNHAVELGVEDDGIGFNYRELKESAADKGSLGIMIMEERLELVGGELRIESEIGKGTHVMAEIPID